MQEKDMWSLLFQDEPVSEDFLQQTKMGIMDQILVKPIDFQAVILRTQRRKLGLLLLALVLITGLSYFSLIWFKGSWFINELNDTYSWFFQYVRVFSRLRIGLELLWQQYAWAFLAIAFSWVLFDGIHYNMFIKN